MSCPLCNFPHGHKAGCRIDGATKDELVTIISELKKEESKDRFFPFTWVDNEKKIIERPTWSFNMDELADQIQKWREWKGFKTPDGICTPEKRTLMMEKLMLVVTEVSEAAEAIRQQDESNFWEELADIMIRILDISGACGVSMMSQIHNKMDFNYRRPEKHGKEL